MTDGHGHSLVATPRDSPRYRVSRFRRWWSGFIASHAPWVRDQRAINLLKRNLSPTQRDQYERDQSFDVIGGRSGRRYRIHHGYIMNVAQLDASGQPVRKLCFLPAHPLPIADIMLAQKLALELFEVEALAIAHQMIHPRSSGRIRIR
jgi:hypothetical protein